MSSPGDVVVQVASGGQLSNGATFTYTKHTIDFASPLASDTSPSANSMLTLSGQNFGTSGAVVKIGTYTCPIISQQQSFLSCRIPAGQGKDLPISVNINSVNVIYSKSNFSYNTPVIDSWSTTTSFPTDGGSIITVRGKNFGIQNPDPVFTVGGRLASMIEFGTTAVKISLPAGFGANLPVSVSVSEQSATG